MSVLFRSALFPLVLWLLAGNCVFAPPARAQVRRCTTPDGLALYTDRPCADLGAVERAPERALGVGGVRLYRGGCARNLQDLAYEMTTAIDAHDVNRLAGVYHWVGVSSGTAVRVMDQLERVVARPLADIVPVFPAAVGDDPLSTPQGMRRAPLALRVEQTQANGITPATTRFALRRHLDCWWISL